MNSKQRNRLGRIIIATLLTSVLLLSGVKGRAIAGFGGAERRAAAPCGAAEACGRAARRHPLRGGRGVRKSSAPPMCGS